MNQTTPTLKPRTTNTQSVRLPIELYDKIANMALFEDTTMNAMIIRLVNMGISNQNDFDRAVKAFVFRHVSPQEIQDLMNGKVNT